MEKHRGIIFLHIEKAGGSTLHNILHNFYDRASVLHLEYMSDGKNEIANADLARLKLVKGHNTFGAHRYLTGEWKYYTMLRNPVDRVISYFYYVKQKSIHHHSVLIREKGWDIGSYIREAENLQMDNGQVRYISGAEKPFGKITRQDLDLAKSNIEKHFLTLGLMERFDESLLLLKKALGWNRMPVYERANVNNKKNKEHSPGEMSVIQEYNRWDIELYEFSREIFNHHAGNNKSFLESEMRKMQRATRIYYLKKGVKGLITGEKNRSGKSKT